MPNKITVLSLYSKRPKFDDFYTPPEAVYPLLKYLPYYLQSPPENFVIWECCDPGKSEITRILREHGYKVISTDILTGFNFLTDSPDFYFDMIITNPPFSLKNEFLKRCYEYRKPFALLLPLTALEGKTRGKLFKEYGISVIVLDKRINYMAQSKQVWFNSSWFVWGFTKPNKLFFETI